MGKNKIKASKKVKLSNLLRIGLMVVSIILFAIGSGNLFKIFTNQIETVTVEDEIYKYTNKFSSNYKVNIKSNPYIEEQTLPAGQTYISDLISSIDMNLNYSYTDSEARPISYHYKIDTTMKAIYTKNEEDYTVLNKTENLKTVDSTQTTSDKLKIDENVIIDYSKYHQIIKDFKQTLGMNVESYLYVTLTVDTVTNVDSQEVKNQYTSDYAITLGDKIALVTNKNNDIKAESVKGKVEETKKLNVNKVYIAFYILLIAISVYVVYWIIFKTEKLNSIKNEFKIELNNILKSCQDRIVIVENQVDTDIDNTIVVVEFGELIKLSEELYKPILCWIAKEEKEEAHFSVISNRVRYVYRLKVNPEM